MAEWFAFLIVIFEECVAFLSSCTILGVPVIGIIVGSVILCVILRSLIYGA